MKKAIVLIFALALMMPFAAFADDNVYTAKCKMCHGEDGKKSPKADLTSADIQKKSVDDIAKFILTGEKHNFGAKGVTEAQAKATAAFVKTLK